MDEILSHDKEYQLLTVRHEPTYDSVVAAIDIVKKFIMDHGLVIYGGTGLDYALRLRGDKIYPDDMLLIPDLDMYSYDNVEHAYALADLLYSRGYKAARAINAQHMETMRVDAVDNHFIADITYRPREIFDKLPTINYNGMKIIHPTFQRIDLHSGFSFPYDNSPREVIFARWNKDLPRFNKLALHYPLEEPTEYVDTRLCKAPDAARKYVFTGFAAYALLYYNFAKSMRELGAEIPPGIIDGGFTASGDIEFQTLDQQLEIVHFNPVKAAHELGLDSLTMYEPYANMVPLRIIGTGDVSACVYSTKNKLLSANSIRVGDTKFRIANTQYLLRHFLSMYFFVQSPKTANVYMLRYLSITRMISAYESAIVGRPDETELALSSPLFPSVTTYGSDNIDLSRHVALNSLYNELDGEPKYKIPMNYYPDRSLANGKPHPTFDPEQVIFFRERGRVIPPEQWEEH